MKNSVLSVILVAIATISMMSCTNNDPETVKTTLDKLNAHFEATGHSGMSTLTNGKTARIFWQAKEKHVDEPVQGRPGYVITRPVMLAGRSISMHNYHWFGLLFWEGNTLEAAKDNNGEWTWKVTNKFGWEINGPMAQRTIKELIEKSDKFIAES